MWRDPLFDDRDQVRRQTQRRGPLAVDVAGRIADETQARAAYGRLVVERSAAAARRSALASALASLPAGGATKGSAYGALFNKVFNTATRLSEIDVDRQRALAERAKAEADKAKAEADKAKLDAEKLKAEKAKVEEKLEALQKELIDSSISRTRCTGDCDDDDDDDDDNNSKSTAKKTP